jgi:Flp pilus assembly pilin Flp
MRAFVVFARDESAVSAVKYGLIAASISLAIVTVLQGVGSRLLHAVE